jgi:hypothetical protein
MVRGCRRRFLSLLRTWPSYAAGHGPAGCRPCSSSGPASCSWPPMVWPTPRSPSVWAFRAQLSSPAAAATCTAGWLGSLIGPGQVGRRPCAGLTGLRSSPPPPGVPGLPQAGRPGLPAPAAAGDLRQLRHPQAPQGACLAGHAPAHPAALHGDLGVVAEPGRGVLLDRGASGAAPRQLRRRDRPHRRHRRFCVAWNHHCQPFAWTKPANEILAKLNRQNTSAADSWPPQGPSAKLGA